MWIKAAVLLAFAAFAFALPAPAQYPGQIAKPETNAPDMRAVAVFEWTGDEAHPKAGRLVPVCIYDGQDLNDAGVYLTQPEPLALQSDVEYQLQHDGQPSGLFDIDTSAHEQGGWVGYGKWRPLSKSNPAPTQVAKVDAEDDAQSDVPILHRKHHADDSAGGGTSGSGSSPGADPGSSAPAPDPDRPTLHKGGDASTSNSGANSGTGSGGSSQTSSGSSSGTSSNSGAGSSASPQDPDRPVLHHTDDSSSPGNGSGSASGNGSGGDSGNPKLKKKKKDDDEAYVSDVASATDPDRPHLFYGKPSSYGAAVLPTLFGLPVDMQQTVAVSDAIDRPEHVWSYTWANPDDEDKMKAAMEDLARTALGITPPPAPKPKSAATHRSLKPAAPPPPAPLLVEQFRVFELAYGSGATMVLSAHTLGTGAQEKFVTLIGQPDLYGGVVVLVKNITDAAHLDLTPRMRLVDAVDAEADNRGELLFELRGATDRQFALYRVLRGDATRIFLSGPESFAAPVAN
ncbi:MAG: hypothetical protein ABSF75_05505 [Terracidiphilus sp.]